MPSITTDLAALLSTVRRPGDFFVSGTTELLAPLLEVDGVGTIALPLLPMQAEQLVAVAQRAPYGRGEETLVDTAVRRTWQIGAGRVRIRGKRKPGACRARPPPVRRPRAHRRPAPGSSPGSMPNATGAASSSATATPKRCQGCLPRL